ncbi:MAG: LuxR C-terminal-related transcriptional regulator [Oscillospiraceae bacterium]
MNIFSTEGFHTDVDLTALTASLSDQKEASDGLQKLSSLASALADAHAGVLQVLDSLPVAIYIADREGKTVFINQSYSALTNITLDEVIGKAPQEIELEGKLFVGSITAEVIRLKQRVSSIAVLVKDGINIPAVTLGCPIMDEQGELTYAVTAILNTSVANGFTFHPQPHLYSGERIFAEKYGISPRELDLIDLMFYGFTYEQAAEKLYISINTVRAHMRNIYRKTEAQNLGSLLQLYKDFKNFNLISFPKELE